MEENNYNLMDGVVGTPNLLDQNSPLYLFMSNNSNNTNNNNNTNNTNNNSNNNNNNNNDQPNIHINNSVDQQQIQIQNNEQMLQKQQQEQQHEEQQLQEKQKLEQQYQQQYQQVEQTVRYSRGGMSPITTFPQAPPSPSVPTYSPSLHQSANGQQQSQLSPPNQQQQQQQQGRLSPMPIQQQQQGRLSPMPTQIQLSPGGSEVLDYHYLTPPQAPPPPPVPHFQTLQQPVENTKQPIPVFTAQLLMQQRNLRPVSEKGQDDKKKEALAFLSFYFRVVPGKKQPSLPRSTVLSLYTNKISIDKRYKQPNDMANLCGAVYTFIFQNLDEGSIRDYIASAENERSTSKNDIKKRKRRKNHDVSNGLLSNHDAFLTCIKYASLLPFIEFIQSSELSLKTYGIEFKAAHPEWAFTHDELARWESELRDYKQQGGKRNYSGIDDNEFAVNNSYTIGGTGTVIPIGGGTLANTPSLSLSSNNGGLFNDGLDGNGNNAFSSSSLLGANGQTTTTTTTSNNCNNNNNSNNNNNNPGGTSCVNYFRQNSIPVNVSETNESFIIYAFIPFYKPNALKITVNQMDIILEGVISLPDTIQIPNGAEISVPNSFVNCKQMDIQEGHFSKVIRLSSPIAASTVGKRDGVVVIIAKKEEKPSTVHQL